MARSFNVSNPDKIDYGTGGGVGAGSPWSCSAWVKLNSTANSYGIVSKRDAGSSGNNQFDFETVSGGNIAVTTDGNFAIGNAALSASGAWQHAATTNDSSSANLYVNGVNSGLSADGSSRASGSGTGQGFRVGWTGDSGGAKFMDGALADVAVWNVKLTPAEVLALASGVRPNRIRPANLVFWAPLDGLASNEPSLAGVAPFTATLTGTTKTASGPPVDRLTRLINIVFPAGGASFAQTISVSASTAVSFVRSTLKSVAVSSVTATTFIKSVAKKIVVGCATAVTAAGSFISGSGTTFNQTVSAGCSTATTFARSVGKNVAVTCSTATAMFKSAAKKLAVSCASATTFIKSVAKKIVVGCSTVAAVFGSTSGIVHVVTVNIATHTLVDLATGLLKALKIKFVSVTLKAWSAVTELKRRQ